MPCGKSEAGQRVFEQNPGGAPANVLACLNKCGKKIAFVRYGNAVASLCVEKRGAIPEMSSVEEIEGRLKL